METRNMNFLEWVAFILLVVGGINWGLVGFFGFDLVAFIFGSMSFVSRVVYALVGLSAVYVAFLPAMLGGTEKYMGGKTAMGQS
jgi:uncharacterized membrane protein YuzA (DUF378 family)